MSKQSQYSVPLIFKKIMDSDFSGELILNEDNYTKNLFFKYGNLIYAKSDIFDEKLGVLLFLLGTITEEQYEYIGGLAHSVDHKVGDILIQNNFISEEDLKYARIYQIKKIAVNSFLLKNFNYELNEMDSVDQKNEFSIPLPSIIIEGVRIMKDLSYFKDKIQFHSPSTLSVPKSIKQILSDDELELYNNLNNCKNMSNLEIISSFTLNPENYWKKMLVFFLLEIIDFHEHEYHSDINENIHDLIELNSKLSEKKLSFYNIMSVDRNSSAETITKAYKQMSQKYNPKNFGSALTPEVKKIAKSVSSKLELIHQNLLILNKKILSKIDEKNELIPQPAIQSEILEDIVEEKNENVLEKTNDTYQIAEENYKLGNYQNVIDILKNQLIGAPLNGEHYYLLGLSQYQQDFKNIEAEINLKKAVKLNPWSSNPIYSLGMLYKKQDKQKLAEKCFERVMSMTADHKDAVHAIQDLHKNKKRKSSIFSVLKKDIKIGSK